MVALDSASTDALPPGFLRDVRAFLDDAFAGAFTDDDWDHARGGMHVWLVGSRGLISHGSLVERTLICSNHTMRVGYVEARSNQFTEALHDDRAVNPSAGALLRWRPLYQLGVLSTGAHSFYESLGWERWSGPTFVNGPRGHERTPEDDDGIMILRTPRSLSLTLWEISCATGAWVPSGRPGTAPQRLGTCILWGSQP
jgi:aminoglycoside 2'-N-acetyltransferase I